MNNDLIGQFIPIHYGCVLIILTIILVGGFTTVGQAAQSTDYNTTAEFDKEINSLVLDNSETRIIDNQTILLNKYVTLKDNSKLILRNCNLFLDAGFKNEVFIEVSDDSTLIIQNSTINSTKEDTPIIVGDEGELFVKNTNLRYMQIVMHGGRLQFSSSRLMTTPGQLNMGSGSSIVNISDSKLHKISLTFSNRQRITMPVLNEGKIQSLHIDLPGQVWEGDRILDVENSVVSKWAIIAGESPSNVLFKDSNISMFWIDIWGKELARVNNLQPGHFARFALREKTDQTDREHEYKFINTSIQSYKLIFTGNAVVSNSSHIQIRSHKKSKDMKIIVENSTITKNALLTGRNVTLVLSNSVVDESDLQFFDHERANLNASIYLKLNNSTINTPITVGANYVQISGEGTINTGPENTYFRSDSKLVRIYPVHIKTSESALPSPTTAILVNDNTEVVWRKELNSTTRNVQFPIQFTKQNYLDDWTLKLRLQNKTFEKNIDLFTETPIEFSIQRKSIRNKISKAKAIYVWRKSTGRQTNPRYIENAIQLLGKGELAGAKRFAQRFIANHNIVIDGNLYDWNTSSPAISDPQADSKDPSGDIRSVDAVRTRNNLYVYLRCWNKIGYGKLSAITIQLDTDNDGKRDVHIKPNGHLFIGDSDDFQFFSVPHNRGEKSIEWKVPLRHINNSTQFQIRSVINDQIREGQWRQVDKTNWARINASSTLHLSIHSSTGKSGDRFRIVGTLHPKHTMADVMVYVKGPKQFETQKNVTTNSSGRFQTKLYLPHNGTYRIQAKWSGDFNHLSDSSQVHSISTKRYAHGILLHNYTITNRKIRPGNTTTLIVNYTNSNKTHEKTRTFTLYLNGTSVKTKIVTVPPGQSNRTKFEITKNTTGTYDVRVGNLTGTIRVDKRQTVTKTEPTQSVHSTKTEVNSPGYGTTGILPTIMILTLLAMRRRRS